MKKLNCIFLVCLFAASLSAQPNSYGYGKNEPPNEPGKCFAQCLMPGDTTTSTKTVKIKDEWNEVTVIGPKKGTQEVTYVSREECTTCEFTTEKTKKEETFTVVIKDGYTYYETTPCNYVTVYDTIITKEASFKYVITDPVFKKDKRMVGLSGRIEEGICTKAKLGTGVETVEIKEACTDIEVADYIWDDEVFFEEVKGPTTKWVKRKADKNCLSENPEDCLVWCLVEVPAEKKRFTRKVKKGCPYGFEDNGSYCFKKNTNDPKYKNYKKITCEEDATFEKVVAISDNFQAVDIEVLVKNGTYTKVEIPVEYKIVARQVIKEPAQIKEVKVPEVTQDIKMSVMEQFVEGIIKKVPAQYASCTKEVCEKDAEVVVTKKGPEFETISIVNVKNGGFTEWKEVLCPADITSYTIRQIQNALAAKGYDPGPIDNVLGSKTKSALTQFQRDNNLPVGQLDLQTLAALGIQF